MAAKNIKDIPGFEELTEEDQKKYWKEALKIYFKKHPIFALLQFVLPFVLVILLIQLLKISSYFFAIQVPYIPFLAAFLWIIPQRFYFTPRIIQGASLIASELAKGSLEKTN